MRKTLAIFFIFLAGLLCAQVPERPNPPKLYNNLSREFPAFLNGAEAAQLEEKLEVFANETSNQICVVIVDDLNGMDAGEYAFKIGNTWGVGKEKFDNGIVILIKPTGNAGGRDLFIATGYGLEGAIPDLATKRIREEMYPFLKSGQNYAALDKGTDILMKLAKGEISVKDYTRSQRRGREGKIPVGLIIVIVVIIAILSNRFRGGGGGHTISRAGRSIFWGSMLGGGFGRSGGGRGWGGGGSSGGGWGGFGGGGFGGGGSGGKW